MRRAAPLLVVLTALAAWAMPAAAPTEAQVQPPAVSRTRLANGLIVLVRENPSAPVVAMNLMIGSGVRAETRETAGVSNLLQLMVVRGTNTKDGTQIVEAAEQMGGSIEAFGEVDAAEIAATALSRHWRDMMALVADVALNPTLPDATTQAVKDFLLRQIRNRAERPYEAGLDRLRARAFGAHPYAWNPLGLPESVSRLDRPALIAHYRRHYVTGGMVLAVSGRVKSREVVAEAQKLFAEILTGTPPAVSRPAPPAAATTRDVIQVPGAQAQILMG
ncbi:MAG TPA: pitrilysin family protein, partial [Candidatus Limnocylindrales bacterium]|nr:pitrilysin family protein [Candidatus Limnocylindrales bacterium]